MCCWVGKCQRPGSIYRVFSGREEALKMASKQSLETNSLPLRPERPKKAEQLFLVQQAPQHPVPLQHSVGKPYP